MHDHITSVETHSHALSVFGDESDERKDEEDLLPEVPLRSQ